MREFLKGLSKNTKKSYWLTWKRFQREGYGFTFDEVLRFIQNEVEAGKTLGTVRGFVSALKRLFQDAGIEFTKPQSRKLRRESNEARDNWKNMRGPAEAVTLDEVRKVVSALLEEDTIQAIRDAVVIRLGFQTFARRAELSSLDVRDINFRTGHITFRRTKADQDAIGKTRPLAPEVLELVGKYLTRAGHTDGPLFRGLRGRNAGGRLHADGVADIVSKRFKQVLKLEMSTHSLRHGAATHFASLPGISVADLAWAGRWKDVSVAISYCSRGKDSKMVNLV